MAVGGTGVGVDVGVAVGGDVGVFWTGWKGVRVGSISIAGWVRGVQAAMLITRQRYRNFFLDIDSKSLSAFGKIITRSHYAESLSFSSAYFMEPSNIG